MESTLLVELPPSGLLVLIAIYGWGCCRLAMTAVVGPDSFSNLDRITEVGTDMRGCKSSKVSMNAETGKVDRQVG